MAPRMQIPTSGAASSPQQAVAQRIAQGITPAIAPGANSGAGLLAKPKAAVAAPVQQAAAPVAQSFGGGGGGGGGVAAAVAPAAPPLTFDQYVAQNFGYQQAQNENGRKQQDFDAETLRAQQQTQADQALKRQALQQSLQDMGSDTANDFADRGLLRSGLYLQGQDKVDQAGVQGNQGIDQLLTQFTQQRQTDQQTLDAQKRSALNDVLSQLSQQFNGTVLPTS